MGSAAIGFEVYDATRLLLFSDVKFQVISSPCTSPFVSPNDPGRLSVTEALKFLATNACSAAELLPYVRSNEAVNFTALPSRLKTNATAAVPQRLEGRGLFIGRFVIFDLVTDLVTVGVIADDNGVRVAERLG